LRRAVAQTVRDAGGYFVSDTILETGPDRQSAEVVSESHQD